MKKDLDKEVRRLNLELAALADEAHDLWTERYAPSANTIDDRRALTAKLESVERLISTREKEREIAIRALKYRNLAEYDEVMDGFAAVTSEIKPPPPENTINLDELLETVKPTNGHTSPKETPAAKTPVRRRPGRPRKVAAG